MKYTVVILKSAEQDLRELKAYLVRQFGINVWNDCYHQIKAAIDNLKAFPFSGTTPDELQRINLAQYHQAIAGKNRIIYEVRQTTVYVYLVVDTRRDMKSMLTRRLLRMER
jgi:plasmid stabilization system protein ParE